MLCSNTPWAEPDAFGFTFEQGNVVKYLDYILGHFSQKKEKKTQAQSQFIERSCDT